QAGQRKIILRVFAGVVGEAFERVVGRIHGPDNFVERTRGLARRGADLLRVLLDFTGQILVGLGHFAEQRDLREIRAQLVVEVARDAGALLFDQFLLLRNAQLAFQFGSRDQINDSRQRAKQGQRGRDDERTRLPERRLDDDGNGRAGVVPNAILVAGGDAKHIFARRQPGQVRHPLTARVRRFFIAAFELVFEPHRKLRALRRGKIQAGEMDFQLLVLRGQRDAFRPGGAQRIVFLRHAIHQHGFDDDGRRIAVWLQVRRVDGDKSFRGGEPKPAVVRANRGGLHAGRTFAREKRAASYFPAAVSRKIRKRFFPNAHQALIRADPEIFQIVLDKIANVIDQTVVLGEFRPGSCLQPRETVGRSAGPEDALVVHQQAGNVLEWRVNRRNFSIAQLEQPAAFGADPKVSLVIVGKSADGVWRQPIGD